jgi:hypothetical protein
VTTIQQLAEVRRVTGQPITLRLGEELLQTSVSDQTVMLVIRTVRIQERYVGYKVTAQGTKLIICELGSDGIWSIVKTVAWDPDFVPYEVGTIGGKSEADYRDHVAWEDDCFRPGNRTRLGSRDSADRVLQGYDYTQPQFYSTQSTRKV